MDLPIKEHLKKIARVKNSPIKRLDYMRLDKNEGIAVFSPEMIDLFRKEITPDFLTAYPEVDSLQRKIANQLELGSDNVYVTAGSDAGIKAAFEVFVRKGDKVMLLDPTYAMFYVYAGIFEAKLVKIGFDKNLSLDVEMITRMIEEHKPKLICIANPNSPTGTILASEEMKEIASRAFGQESILLIDEAYYPFYPVSALDLVGKYSNVVITRTFSKAMSLASARAGFALGQEKIIEALHKVRPMYETNAFAVKFSELIMDNPEMIDKNLNEVKAAKEYVEARLGELGLKFFKSYANFILIDVGSFDKSVEVGKALMKRKILIKSGFSDENLKQCIRISMGNIDQMKNFIKNLEEVL